jgi:hypothetical protein
MCRNGERAPEPVPWNGGGEGKQDKRVRHPCARKCRSAHGFLRHDALRARAARIAKSALRLDFLRAACAHARPTTPGRDYG